MKSFEKHWDYGFFDQDIRLSKLSKLGDPLERLKKGVAFDVFCVFWRTNCLNWPKGKGKATLRLRFAFQDLYFEAFLQSFGRSGWAPGQLPHEFYAFFGFYHFIWSPWKQGHLELSQKNWRIGKSQSLCSRFFWIFGEFEACCQSWKDNLRQINKKEDN